MNNTRKPRILITNDDGVKNANLHDLASALSPLGEVFVFAPETEQSGVSQAFTVRSPLRVKKVSASALHGAGCIANDSSELPYEVYSVSGTPADSAKFALGYFAGLTFAKANESALDIHGKPTFDVCFSGVNVGENSGVSSLYSGTVAGAREAALWGVPAVALSVSLGGESLMPEVLDFAKRIVVERMFDSIPKGTFWNVNFPKATADAFKGYAATKMALGMFTDHYDSNDASGVDGTWQLDGEKLWDKEPVDSDDYMLHKGYATITPHRIDQTDVESLNRIKMAVNAAEK